MTEAPAVVPHGAWPSPVTLDAVVAAGASLDHQVQVVAGSRGAETFWAERRPDEGGRVQVVRRLADGTTADLLPEGFSARSRVHEYGGGAWLVAEGWLLFNNDADQRLYRAPLADAGDAAVGDGAGLASEPQAFSPEPAVRHGRRHADLAVAGEFVVCVRELHHSAPTPPSEVVNEIVGLPLDGDGDEVVLVTGADFVSNPRLSPDGTMLAWVEWDHPAMPWTATRVCTAPLAYTHDHVSLGQSRELAGGASEAAIMPVWSPDGQLHLVSDRTGWWNIDASENQTSAQIPRTELEADIGTPLWVFGMARYAFLADGRIVFAAASGGLDRMGVVELTGAVTWLDLPHTEIESVVARAESVVFIGAGFTQGSTVVEVPLPPPGSDGVTAPGPPIDLHAPPPHGLGDEAISVGRTVSFPSGPGGRRTAHAVYYPPVNPAVVAPTGDLPPLLVMIHGGPTGMSRARFDLARQFWTSRGFAIVDVNYGGSTGFGRDYRELLDGQWGVVDVEDCIAAAIHLADQGLADPARLCIRGGSAGGYTVLAALVASDSFAAGSSSYGIADVRVLAEETHKFESRYCDTMIGPYPEDLATYEARSPINHVDRLTTPLIVFQGLDDEVVPPNQAEMIVDALRAKGVPVAYFPFEGEGHGWRRSATIATALGAELTFYGRILSFEPADRLPPVDIHNLPE